MVPEPRIPRRRPNELPGKTIRVLTGHGVLYVTVNLDEAGHPFEVIATLGKAGGCDAAQNQAIGLLVSLALSSGIDPEIIAKQLRGITCCPTWDDGVLIRSNADAIAIVLQRVIDEQGSTKAT